ncbi:hypothetical protein TorRG33x02_242130 [Trema orientale]|uniref:Uncharacterized protein n=1 Tax=Trema orientale TaxID=63057 RepID=A0A2P5DU04_TREOI|nr:hypothetical protein TorRG33x02_242130 [Trema orientale]
MCSAMVVGAVWRVQLTRRWLSWSRLRPSEVVFSSGWIHNWADSGIFRPSFRSPSCQWRCRICRLRNDWTAQG